MSEVRVVLCEDRVFTLCSLVNPGSLLCQVPAETLPCLFPEATVLLAKANSMNTKKKVAQVLKASHLPPTPLPPCLTMGARGFHRSLTHLPGRRSDNLASISSSVLY